ncbi:MAG TPA: thioredoxin family protein [Actinomycetota bacterium]|nr:thioredoxin family protein [Actinomycetota bacterium]
MIARLIVALAVAGIAVALAVLWRRREGRFDQGTGRFTPADLGIVKLERPSAVLVEFYGIDCAPCVTVQKRIAKIAEEIPELQIVSIDAGARMDVADKHEVRRVPTLFVLDPDLRVIWRASGVPSEDAIRTALLGPDWAGRPTRHTTQQQRVRR